MRTLSVCAVMLSSLVLALPAQSAERKAEQGATLIVHNVFFALKDNAPAKVQELVNACSKYLSKHPGEVYFSTGPRAKEFARDVNVQDWDVALHIVFQTKADHDRYADAPRHVQFIQENQANWKKVRVFDSLLAAK